MTDTRKHTYLAFLALLCMSLFGCPSKKSNIMDAKATADNMQKSIKVEGTNYVLTHIKGGHKVVLNIEFESGKWGLKDTDKELLQKVSKTVQSSAHSGSKIQVQGHTDSIGKRETNVNLSKYRAKSVLDYLVSQGVDKGRIQSVGFGPDKPIGDNKTSEGRKRNRRVEIYFIKPSYWTQFTRSVMKQ